MSRRLYLLLVTLLAGGLIAIGCGDDDDNGGGSDEPAQEESGGGAGGGDAPQSVEEGVERCKQAVTANPQLKDDTKADLEEICEKAGEGDADAVREASREACVKVVEDTEPAGPTREQAIERCERGGEQ